MLAKAAVMSKLKRACQAADEKKTGVRWVSRWAHSTTRLFTSPVGGSTPTAFWLFALAKNQRSQLGEKSVSLTAPQALSALSRAAMNRVGRMGNSQAISAPQNATA
jgi:hypothetical protein